MQRIPVQSSNLASVGYDEQSNTLEIAFHNRAVYQYFNVPRSIYTGLMNASSKGKYAASYIYKQYRQKRIN